MKAKKVMAFVLSVILAAGTMMPGAEMAAYAAEEAVPSDSETAEEEAGGVKPEEAGAAATEESDPAASDPEPAVTEDGETEEAGTGMSEEEQAPEEGSVEAPAETSEEASEETAPAAEEAGAERTEPSEEAAPESAASETGTAAAEAAGNDNHFRAFLTGYEDSIGICFHLSPGEEKEVQVEVQADDYSGVTYTWLKNGSGEVLRKVTAEEINEQNGVASKDSFWISGDTQGIYRVKVEDGYGNSFETWFEVLVDNHFYAYPEGAKKAEGGKHPDTTTTLYADPGQEIALHVCVEAADREGITYEWYDEYYSDLEESSDTFTFSFSGERSWYCCYVNDRYGNTGYAEFLIEPAETFTAYPEGASMNDLGEMEDRVELSASRNEEVTLKAVAQPYEGTELTYSWSSTGDDEESGDLSKYSTNTVTIHPESSQTCYCRISDQNGNSKVLTFDVKVNHFTAWPENELVNSGNGERTGIVHIKTREGEKVTLTVLVDGDDTDGVSYLWERENCEDWTSEEIEESGPSIEVAADYRYEYRCCVTDGYGNSEDITFMIMPEDLIAYPENPVLYSDGRKADSKEVPAFKGETLTLRVVTEPGDATGVSYRWYEDGEEIAGSEANGSTLTVTADQSANYSCRVSQDDAGSQYVTFRVTVEGDEDPVIRLEASGNIESVSDGVYHTAEGEECTIRLTVEDTGTSDSRYTAVWMDEDRKVVSVGSDEFSFTVTGDTEYFCKVTNSAGRTATSGLTFRTGVGLTALPAGRTENSYYSDDNLLQIISEPGRPVTLEVEATAEEDAQLHYTWQCRSMDFKGDQESGWRYFDIDEPKLAVTPGEDTRYECIVSDQKGNYAAVRFDVLVSGKKDLSRAVIKLLETELSYNGKALEPGVCVIYKGEKLTEGRDYTVTYRDNVYPFHFATALVMGAGEFTGRKLLRFHIEQIPQNLTVTAPALTPGASGALTVKNAKGHLYYDVVSGRDVVTVDSKGNLKALKVGTARVLVGSSASPGEGYKKAEKTITVKVLPAAPATLRAANMVTCVKLTWKKVPGATGYILKRAGKTIKTISGGSTVSFLDYTANKNGTTYNYSIYAKAATGTSRQYTRTGIIRLTRPVFTSVTNGTSKAVTLKWKKNAAVTGYIIEYSTKSDFAGAQKVTIAKPSAVTTTIRKLAKNKTCYVRIRVYKKVGTTRYYSLWSPARKIRITK